MGAIYSDEYFNERYNLFSKELYSVAYGYTLNKADAEDIVQDVFMKYLKLHKEFPTLDDEKYYLIRMTINEALNFIKRNKKVVYNDEVVSYTPDQLSEKNRILLHMVNDLPDKYRDIIMLSFYKSYSDEFISSVLKISKALVRKRRERALEILRKEYKHEWH